VRIGGTVALQVSLQSEAYFAAAEYAEHSRAGYGRAAGASVSVTDSTGAVLAEYLPSKIKLKSYGPLPIRLLSTKETSEMARAAFILTFAAFVLGNLFAVATAAGL
jgi:hypothetical protein